MKRDFTANASAQTRTHNAVHELNLINGTALTYDAKGNLTHNSNGLHVEIKGQATQLGGIRE